jgi:hypothetical protein
MESPRKQYYKVAAFVVLSALLPVFFGVAYAGAMKIFGEQAMTSHALLASLFLLAATAWTMCVAWTMDLPSKNSVLATLTALPVITLWCACIHVVAMKIFGEKAMMDLTLVLMQVYITALISFASTEVLVEN